MAVSFASSTAAAPELGEDFPIICNSCLGPNPYTRMIKSDLSKQCKITGAPFTSFRWQGELKRWKETVIGSSVAREKNCCQSCLNDLEYAVPYQVRDRVMDAINEDKAPSSDVNREYYWSNKRQRCDESASSSDRGTYEKLQDNVERLREFAALDPGPVVWQNRAPLSAEELEKLRRRRQAERTPPSDQSITSLFVGGVPPAADRAELLPLFLPYGEVRELTVDTAKLHALVTFHERSAAEAACAALYNKTTLTVRGARLRVSWARRRARSSGATTMHDYNSGGGVATSSSSSATMQGNVVAPPPPLPPPPGAGPGGGPPLPRKAGRPPPPGIRGSSTYPSMNPDGLAEVLGARPETDV